MKKLSIIAAALALSSASAFAATDSFDVEIVFTGTCSVTTGAKDFSFAYTAFAGAMSDTSSTVFQCSRGLTPTFSLNSGVDMAGDSAVALNSNVTGSGVISGVRYTITGTTARTQTGTAATAGAAGTVGTPDLYTVGLTVAVPQQAGSGATGTGIHTRTLTIAY